MGIWLCRDVMKFEWDYTENFASAKIQNNPG